MNNFVFHEEYIIDLPEDKRPEFLEYIINYGIYGKEPELQGFEFIFWKTIQRRIDLDKVNYDISCLKQRINAINGRVKNNKASENDLSNLDSFKTKLNELNEVKRNNSFKTNLNKLNELNEKNRLKLTHHDIDIDNEFDIDIDIDIDNDIEAPAKATPSQVEYSKKVFELMKDADLPCARKNEISFLQTDFKNAISFIHNSETLHSFPSADIIDAVKNYIKVLKDPDCFFSAKMNFFSLVKCKSFYNFLPSNFDISNFKKYGAKEEPEQKIQESYDVNSCPFCNNKTLKYIQTKDVFHCDTCNKDTPFDEVMR